jgi:siroheme synthase (precorrin-2 oxidase/ferrochelatase)
VLEELQLGISTQSAGEIIAARTMRAGETALQMCIRHVAEQETRIARQETLIERLRENRSALLGSRP